MMRRCLLGVAALTLQACATFDAPSGCNRSATREIAWSAAPPDQLTVSVSGIDCGSAETEVVVRDRSGAVVLRQHAIGYVMAEYGDSAAFSPPPVVEPAEIDRFLGSMVDTAAALRTTRDLPEWPADQAHVLSARFGSSYESLLPRDAYDALRQRDLPLLCIDVGPESATCFIYDSNARGALAVASYGL